MENSIQSNFDDEALKHWARRMLSEMFGELNDNYYALKRAVGQYRDTLPLSPSKWATEQSLLMAAFNKVLYEEHIESWSGMCDVYEVEREIPEFSPVI